jgi:hypothetical protein
VSTHANFAKEQSQTNRSRSRAPVLIALTQKPDCVSRSTQAQAENDAPSKSLLAFPPTISISPLTATNSHPPYAKFSADKT